MGRSGLLAKGRHVADRVVDAAPADKLIDLMVGRSNQRRPDNSNDTFALALLGGIVSVISIIAIVSSLRNARTDPAGLIATLLVVAVLAAVVLLIHLLLKQKQRRRQLEIDYPDDPSQWRSEWDGNGISNQAGSEAFYYGLSVLLLAVCGIFGVRLAPQNRPLVIFVDAVLVAFFLGVAVFKTAKYLRFGASVLQLETFPARAGDRLAGVIHVGRALSANQTVQVRLTCHRIIRRTRSSYLKLLWESRPEPARLGRQSTGSDVEFDIQIPANLPATGVGDDDHAPVAWTLYATDPTSPLGYSVQFPVPVIDADGTTTAGADERGGDVDSDRGGGAGRNCHAASTDPPLEPASHPGITLTRLADGGCVLHFGPGRSWEAATTFTVLPIILILFLYFESHFQDLFLVTLLGGVSAVSAIGALYIGLTRVTITADARGLRVDRGWLSFHRGSVLPAEQIENIELTFYGHGFQCAVYRMSALTEAGPVMLVRDVREKRVATWVATHILAAVGKPKVLPSFPIED